MGTATTAPLSGDRILRGLLVGGRVRLVTVVAGAACAEIGRRHDARGGPAVALARASVAGLLLATLTKGEERVTLQILGDGPLGGLTVDSAASGRVRAYPKRRGLDHAVAVDRRARLAELVGRGGVVNVVRDLGMKEAFGGQTPIVSGEIDEDVEHYLTKSEQLDSVLAADAVLDVQGRVRAAAGILLQALPDGTGVPAITAARQRLRDGAVHRALRGAPEISPRALTRVLLAEASDDATLFDERPVVFACSCSRDRALGALQLVGARELADLAADPGFAETTCEFCQASYRFDAPDLELIVARLAREARPN